jgi:heme/copper-type cytochrome/quinol oxidase subunit 4
VPREATSAKNAAAARVVTGRGAKENGPMRIVIIILLFAVIASLFSGLYFVYKDKGNSNRAVISLTIRIGLSILVFVILMVSYYFGWITERGL